MRSVFALASLTLAIAPAIAFAQTAPTPPAATAAPPPATAPTPAPMPTQPAATAAPAPVAVNPMFAPPMPPAPQPQALAGYVALDAPRPMPPGYLDAPGLWPRTVPYVDGALPPPGYHLGSEPRRGLWIGGLSTFAATYGIALLGGIAAVGDEELVGASMAIPVFGPVAYALAVEDGEPNGRRPLLGLMSLLSLGQATGVALFIAGFESERPVYHRNDVLVSRPRLEMRPGGMAFAAEF